MHKILKMYYDYLGKTYYEVWFKMHGQIIEIVGYRFGEKIQYKNALFKPPNDKNVIKKGKKIIAFYNLDNTVADQFINEELYEAELKKMKNGHSYSSDILVAEKFDPDEIQACMHGQTIKDIAALDVKPFVNDPVKIVIILVCVAVGAFVAYSLFKNMFGF
jgi:hypothetical protein